MGGGVLPALSAMMMMMTRWKQNLHINLAAVALAQKEKMGCGNGLALSVVGRLKQHCSSLSLTHGSSVRE